MFEVEAELLILRAYWIGRLVSVAHSVDDEPQGMVTDLIWVEFTGEFDIKIKPWSKDSRWPNVAIPEYWSRLSLHIEYTGLLDSTSDG